MFFSPPQILLTGTPLQNNVTELFMLLHFLDAGKFVSPAELEEQFGNLGQEEQVSGGHDVNYT